jgi:hypothetical protein
MENTITYLAVDIRPFHSLHKSCARDWAERYPAHMVKE